MSEGFTRTPTGLTAKWHFYSIPTIWVEGPEDIFFYSPIVRDLECRIEAFHGCDNATALIEALIKDDLPYIIILDGDYGILHRKRSRHHRLIYLSKYSFENYLWHCESINYSCHRHAQSGDRADVCSQDMQTILQHIRNNLLDIIVLDIASCQINPSPKILPDRIESLLISQQAIELDLLKVAALRIPTIPIPDEHIQRSRQLVDEFLVNGCVSELLKGHLLLGFLHKLFNIKARSLKGSNAGIREDAFVQLISDSVWSHANGPQHARLKRRIRQETRNTSKHPKLVSRGTA